METLNPETKYILADCYPQIKELNPAQKAVIDSGLLENNSNYIIAIPTASGKTLLGLITALNTILKGGKVVYAAPLISIQNEKLEEFRKLEKFGIKVGKHPGSADLSVMVFESFDAITRFSWNTLREIDLLIIDEFHMIGEYSRGPTIECAISLSKMINSSLRIIALSATLKNMQELSSWLNAEVVEHDYRPVPLYKDILITEEYGLKNKNDIVLRVLNESIEDSSQVLVFVSTRRFTESLAYYISGKVKSQVPRDKTLAFRVVAEKILDVPKKRGSRPTSICLKLAECAENGIAFHHAGLFDKQRQIIENEFRAGNIYMITATPSLMYGVNLPSKNVLIRDCTRWTSRGPQKIPVFDYEQVSGRAGRPGYDTEGYSYLIAESLNGAYDLKDHYIHGDIEVTSSKLIENKDAVYRQIIIQIASTLAKNPQEITEFFRETFYGYQMNTNDLFGTLSVDTMEYEINSALESMVQNGIVQLTSEGLKATDFGNLIARSNYSVETAVRLKEYAKRVSDLNIYQLIYDISRTPDIPKISFKSRKSKEPVMDKLNDFGIFARDIGNDEATTASLLAWIDEKKEDEIENAFNVYASTTRRAAHEASRMVKFFKEICHILNNYSYSYDKLSARLYYGVREDIIPIVVSVKGLGRKLSRALVDTFESDLREVSIDELVKIEGIGPKTAGSIRNKFGKNKFAKFEP